ncbi:MAG: TdeIII family type II restriction endonuclease [Halobacterium sp.]
MALPDETRREITALTKSKLGDWEDTIREMSLDDLRPNIFLATMLDVTSADELIEFYAMQHLERSIVTSFGYLIQDIAVTVAGDAAEETSGNADLILHGRDGDTYIEIKSGTASSNKKMMREMSRQHEAVKAEHPDATTALGLTYGKREDVFGIMDDYYEGDLILVGQEFWEYLSGDPDAYRDVVAAITDAREAARRESVHGKTIQQLIDENIDRLTAEWTAEYSADLDYDDLVERYF